ncbi:MAG: site-specific DNA-methyltransferase [Deltaproteobacteria bacterium]|nr:site-specific DNA-methyltransferase [Deltaproteobacteria bacterium]
MKNTLFDIHNADARNVADYIYGELITTSITSPPYFDMKDYGADDQIGFGQSYHQYLEDLKIVFSSIYKVTKNDGTLWIIIDTFKDKNGVVLLPFDLASKLKEIGWMLQDIIIWKKDKTVPWSSAGFVQRKFEYILFFSKSKNFKYHRDRVRIYDTKHLKKWWVRYPERYNPKGKALDEVWEFSIPTQGSWGDKYIRHFCPLPTDMIGNIIQLTTDEGDIVLDPFSGSGSVLVQAAYMKRKYVGFEINTKYIQMFKTYRQKTLASGTKKYEQLQADTSKQDDFENIILKLRCLKYARVLYNKTGKLFDTNPIKYIVVDDLGYSQETNKLKKVRYSIIYNHNLICSNEFISILHGMSTVTPLSKFGIEPVIELKSHVEDIHGGKSLYGYTSSNTNNTIGEVNIGAIPPKAHILSHIKVAVVESDFE